MAAPGLLQGGALLQMLWLQQLLLQLILWLLQSRLTLSPCCLRRSAWCVC